MVKDDRDRRMRAALEVELVQGRPLLWVVAGLAHEVNRAYCRLAMGDTSQPAWEDAPAWQVESAIEGVWAQALDPTRSVERQHEGWMEHKLREGWRYGPVKDPEAKTHPCLLPFSSLPTLEQGKDRLFISVVLAVLTSLSPQLTAAAERLNAEDGAQAKVAAREAEFRSAMENRDPPDRCMECGQSFSAAPCGPTHALIARERGGRGGYSPVSE